MKKMGKDVSTFSKDSRIKVEDIIARKKNGEKITMLTCYDFSFANIIDSTGVDMVLVGDSLANVVLGMDKTKDISFSEMLNHTKAVSQGVRQAMVIADMPYVTYQKNRKKALYFAKKFIEEGGADGVKLEWFPFCPEVVEILIKNGVPVMGHIGLTPQTADKLGGYRVQGKDVERAYSLIKQAEVLAARGVFSIVIECVPSRLAGLITERLPIPTIGIGAGKLCDGQVLVLYDLLGIYPGKMPKFVRRYADLSIHSKRAVTSFISDVKNGKFPASDESFHMKDEEFEKLRRIVGEGKSFL